MEEVKQKFDWKKEAKNVAITVIACLFGSLGMHVFVYPSNFAPMGIDGVATMLQSLTHVNAGIYTILLNFPLFIVALLVLKRFYVIYTILYILISSAFLMLWDTIGMWQYVTETDKLISSLFSGIMLGVRTGLMIKIGASSGGVDILACVIQSKKPYGNIERFISLFCYVIMGLSYFVYKDMNCILLSIVQLIVFEKVSASVLSSMRNAVEVKIITKSPNEIKDAILFELKHGATIVESKGMFTDTSSAIVYSVINTRQLPEFLKIIKKYPDSFVYYSDVSGVRGNFRWRSEDIAK